MDDHQLDSMLSAAAAPVPRDLAVEARKISSQPEARTKAIRNPARRLLWLVPAVALGALVSAAITTTSAQLGMWPWVELSDGSLRSDPIPVEWQTDDGAANSCRAYVELANADREHIELFNAAIDDYDWAGFGQRLYDDGVQEPDDPTGALRVGSVLAPALAGFTRSVLPDVTSFTEAGSASENSAPHIDAIGLSCRSDDGA